MITLSIRPSFYDLDFGGVVNNIAYLRWMEDARTRLVSEGPVSLDGLLARRVLPVIRRTTVEYLAPLQVGDRATLHVRLTELGRSAWTMEFRFVRERDGVEAVRAEQHGCFVNLDRGKPVAIPPEVREHWLSLAGPGAAP